MSIGNIPYLEVNPTFAGHQRYAVTLAVKAITAITTITTKAATRYDSQNSQSNYQI
jgi:hypothetical protein